MEVCVRTAVAFVFLSVPLAPALARAGSGDTFATTQPVTLLITAAGLFGAAFIARRLTK